MKARDDELKEYLMMLVEIKAALPSMSSLQLLWPTFSPGMG